MIVNWPITKEQYRQVLLDNHQCWKRIKELEALLEGNEAKELEETDMDDINAPWVKLDKPDKDGNTHQCIKGPFCWMFGRVVCDMFIPYSGYGDKIIEMIKDWETMLKDWGIE